MVLGFRDQRRIERMLELLRRYWIAHPDLRLGQMVDDLLSRDIDGDAREPSLVSDDEAESRLRAALKEG